MGKATNTFVSFLTLLGVKHTKSFSEKYFNEHPHKYNLYGLSKMLSDYHIRNGATQIEDNRFLDDGCKFLKKKLGPYL